VKTEEVLGSALEPKMNHVNDLNCRHNMKRNVKQMAFSKCRDCLRFKTR